MPSLKINRCWIVALFSGTVLGMLIANVNVLAQPYERSAVLNGNIEFDFADFEFTPNLKHQNAKPISPKQYRIHYAAAGDKTKPGVIFIHGTPGGWGAFERYLENSRLQHDFYMISVDRMGWGSSKLSKHETNGDFDMQAASIVAIMHQYSDKQWTLVGHSLGASIAPQIALESPNSVDSLLLLAGSLNPRLGKPRWYNWAASTWVVANLIGKSMRYSNREIMALRAELTAMDADLKQTKLDANLTVMQGAKDKLVSPKNPAYVLTEWHDSFANIDLIELSDEGHFLPWRQAPLVIETIYSLRAARAKTADGQTEPHLDTR